MKFNQVHPYVRYARCELLNLQASTHNHPQPAIPYDARFFYTKSGGGAIAVKGKTYEMTEGSVLIINSGTEYQLNIPEEHVEYIIINFDYTYSFSRHSMPIPSSSKSSYDKQKLLKSTKFEDTEFMNDTIYIKNISEIENKLLKIEHEYSMKLLFYENMTSSIFAEILAICARQVNSQMFSGNNKKTEEILNYIHENYALALTNKDIADFFGFHPNYISEMIRICTGMPLHKYLNHVRLSHAVAFLDTGDLNVSEIAEKVGFRDVYHFSQYFKKIMGVSPTKYKQK